MRILHIAAFNTAGIPISLVKAERKLGHDSRLITLGKHQFSYEEDICLDLPFLRGELLSMVKHFVRKLSPKRHNETHVSPPYFKQEGVLETLLLRLRDQFWKNKINHALKSIDIDSIELIQLDGGSGLLSTAKIVKELKNKGKRIICVYYGSDLRIRGISKEIDEVSDQNFSFEYDHEHIYPGINILPFPFDFDNFKYEADPQQEKIVIGHAPSNRMQKGTSQILDGLQKLKNEFSFEISLIENKTHAEALEAKSRCSLFIDQISNLGYGLNAVESLAMGIPTFSSLRQEFKERYSDNPIVEIGAKNMVERVATFLRSRELRYEVAAKSKLWVRDIHDAQKVVKKIHTALSTI